MTSQDKAEVIKIAATVFVAVAFIGGCTTTFLNKQNGNITQACIAASMEWRDGDCVRPEASK